MYGLLSEARLLVNESKLLNVGGIIMLCLKTSSKMAFDCQIKSSVV